MAPNPVPDGVAYLGGASRCTTMVRATADIA